MESGCVLVVIFSMRSEFESIAGANYKRPITPINVFLVNYIREGRGRLERGSLQNRRVVRRVFDILRIY